ncbi:unnamed protein product [Spirodela intermedia]|uniref:Kinesin-like protein n=1 Tax=Spirodela intermedia TaxID=51605 RepID=A0A7I8K6E6_SPIIN|nr:unnamed protein product [Spirodela intermedia]
MGTIAGDELSEWEEAQETASESIAGEDGGGDSGGFDGGGKERIRVSVRLRPLNEEELARNDPSDWECINDTTIIFRNTMSDRSTLPPTAYSFDRVFSCDCGTRQVYEEGAKEVALSVVSGINASIFAYGQTSSGKTYTMTGITGLAATDIYGYIERHKEREFVLKFSAMEIYNESVRDLLSTDNTPLRLLDDPDRTTIVEKLTEETIRNWEHVMELLSICEEQRQIGETSLNKTSSRSHQIIRLTIESSAREFLGRMSASTLAASVHFVDLAGSERASQAMSAGARLKEGCHINRSLLTLGTVIRKLSKGRTGHIPYRDSKLTRILQPSLGGNARTAIICTMSPARSHIEQSRNTLLFATCAKEVVTSAQVNVVMSDKALVKHLQRELARLEGELRRPRAVSMNNYAEEMLREKDGRIQQMENDIREVTRQRDLARSQLEDLLLRTVGDDQESSHQEGIFRGSTSDLPSACGDDLSVDNSSEILHSGFLETISPQDYPTEDANYSKNRQRSSEISSGYYPASPQSSAGGVSSEGGAPTRGGGEFLSLDARPEMDDLCKEVQCIEVEEVSTIRNERSSGLLTSENGHGDWNAEGRASSSSMSRRLSRSRSCRAALMASSPCPWFPEEEQVEYTPPGSSFLGDSHQRRPEDFRRRLFPLNYGVNGEAPSPTTVCSSKAAQTPPREDVDDGQDEKGSGSSVTGRSIKDAGVDPMMSPAGWPEEFERRRLEIIALWHSCNVSLVHRTFFFLLCKGDPADSIYMELELRRLSFLKRALAGGHASNISATSNTRALRRERGMLCRQMQRKLTAAEREGLYRRWGIPLQTKQRKLQLAHLVWTAAGSVYHAGESAAVVARLVGEPDDTHKEMFILSFPVGKSPWQRR